MPASPSGRSRLRSTPGRSSSTTARGSAEGRRALTREIEVTHPERVVFGGDDPITKGEVVAYYRAVAERMLPFLRGRPLSLERYRKTVADGGFYQQGRPDHFPGYVPRIDVVRASGEIGHHSGADSVDALVFLANQGVLTFHGWAAREPDLEHPDRLVLDLDPDGEDFAPVRAAAFALREVLEERGVRGHPLLTGSRGLHVIVPLDGSRDWEGLWAWAKELGAALVKTAPQELTRAFYKSQRRGRLYVDTGRARRGHTAVIPWTVRARPGAPVATPITWDELSDPQIHARSFTLRTALERPADPWGELSLRPARAEDEPFLTELVWLAARWSEVEPPPPPHPLPPELSRYVEGFGRPGDRGVLAPGRGAAWCRLLTDGYGHVADDIPELSLAVRPGHRRRGVATALLTALPPGPLSLSVDPANPAVTLYERLGFVKVGELAGSWTLLRGG